MNDSLAKLVITDLRVWVRLGCGDAEKANPQLVSINLELSFAAPPVAMQTDNIADTVCYYETTKMIQTACQAKEFNLIEHLAYTVYEITLQNSKDKIENIQVTVCKLHPPVPGLHGGVSFIYSQKPSGAQ